MAPQEWDIGDLHGPIALFRTGWMRKIRKTIGLNDNDELRKMFSHYVKRIIHVRIIYLGKMKGYKTSYFE